MENKLNAKEKRTLASLTNKIKAALKSFVTIGELYYQALPLIDRGWAARKSWIEIELGVSETHFYKQVRAFDVYQLLSRAGCPILPHCESVCRELTSEVTFGKVALKYGRPADKEAEGKIRERARELTIQAWKLACENGKPTANRVVDGWAKAINQAFPQAKEDKPGNKPGKSSDKPNQPIQPEQTDPLAGKSSAEKTAAILGAGPASGFSESVNQGAKQPSGDEKKNLEGADLQKEINRLRTALSQSEEERAKLALAVRQGQSDLLASKLAKEVFEAGIKAVKLSALSKKDESKVKALDDLKKMLGM